ncbi:MAG: hypothetical protein HYV52_00505 [Parcubacteria group bacterium]|nr:hypothetical protein [Parcubacteria group bacterium]
MFFQHKELAQGRWSKLSLVQQLGNIGGEVFRVWRQNGQDEKLFWSAVERALELFDLTLNDPRWKGRRREIARAREVFVDAVFGGREYKSSLEDLARYFDQFALAANLRR